MPAGVFLILGITCLLYYSLIVLYAGIQLSFSGIWVLFGFGSILIAWILRSPVLMGLCMKIPKALRMSVLIIAGFGLLLFAGAEGCIIRGMTETPSDTLDGIVVLGAQVRGTRVSKALAQRLDRAITYLLEHPDTYVIVSGGQGPGEDISEAEAMKRYLLEREVDADRILLENQSRNTAQNLRYSFEMLTDSEDRIGLVTNGFHVFRAVHIAKAEGKAVAGIPAETDWWMLPHYMMREAFALAKDFLVGNAAWNIRQ